MNKYNLIESFFSNQEEYIRFLAGLEDLTIANEEATCMAKLEKIDGCFFYRLFWLENGKFIGDYVKPFKASKENIETFNNGCKVLAQRLEVFIDTNDVNQIPNDFPAFKELTEHR
jgi:hypothetical protein